MPVLCKIIELYGPIESLNGFIVLALAVESNAFVLPEICLPSIVMRNDLDELDGLIISLDGIIILGQISEIPAFFVLGFYSSLRLRIELDGHIPSL